MKAADSGPRRRQCRPDDRAQSTHARPQQAAGDEHVPTGRPDGRLVVGDLLPLTLKPHELRRVLGIGMTKFWELQKAGAFRDLEVIPGERFYSGTRVAQRWAEGAPALPAGGGRQFFTRARHARQRSDRTHHAPRKSRGETSRETEAPR